MLKCLVRTYSGVAEDCQREMSRAVRMALWEFRPGAALTSICDADVEQVCKQVRLPISIDWARGGARLLARVRTIKA